MAKHEVPDVAAMFHDSSEAVRPAAQDVCGLAGDCAQGSVPESRSQAAHARPTEPPPALHSDVNALSAPENALADAFTKEPTTSVFWNAYVHSERIRVLLKELDLIFEPIVSLDSREPSLVGFEVLGGLRHGGRMVRYGSIVDHACGTLGVEPDHLQLMLLERQLSGISAVRALLEGRVWESAHLGYSVNFTGSMVGAPSQRLFRYVAPSTSAALELEISEDFPDNMRPYHGEDRETLFQRAIMGLNSVVRATGIRLVLDDTNRAHSQIMAALGGRATKIKYDKDYLQGVLRGIRAPGARPGFGFELLDGMRPRHLACVYEGVETAADLNLLASNPSWSHRVHFQGWGVRLPDRYLDFFEPLHTMEQPRGYLLRREYAALIAR